MLNTGSVNMRVSEEELQRSYDPSTLRQGSWRIAQDSAPSLGPWPRDLGRGIPSEVEGRAHKKGPRAMPVGLHVDDLILQSLAFVETLEGKPSRAAAAVS